jgi:enoyl-CoA hydratase/carnithine racemase
MSYDTLDVAKDGPVATVTLDRPDRLNAINGTMLQDFERLFRSLRSDRETRFVIFTGAGRSFSAGADLGGASDTAETNNVPLSELMRYLQLEGHDFVRSLENLEQITISAINGHALGAGLVIAMASDFRIAASDAQLGVPEANVGIFFTWGCTPRLTRLIGPAKAKEMIMTCEPIDAAEASRIGLVNKVVPSDELMTAARELATTIGARAPLAVRMTKKIVNAASAANFGDLYTCEPELVERLYLSDDPIEGITAFLEKRTPEFSGD